MLHKEKLDPIALELLKRLMDDEMFQSYCLVGGSSLSLRLGLRLSRDIDLFTTENIEINEVLTHLQENYSFTPIIVKKNTIKGEIDGIKVDCIRHAYPMIKPLVTNEGIRFASLLDIAAMKLNAIVISGTRLKDFVDIACLSYYFSLNEMLDAYENKYKAPSIIAFRALGYWEDIDFEEPIILPEGTTFNWDKIQKRLEWILENRDSK